jgi:tetraacyldisaccharide 4'-kinase
LPDHAAPSEDDLRALAARARKLGAGLVTTEKDWVKLPPAWRTKVVAWPVRARFEDETALDLVLKSGFDFADQRTF